MMNFCDYCYHVVLAMNSIPGETEFLGKVLIVPDEFSPSQSFQGASQLLVEDGRREDLVSQSLWDHMLM